ncbi:MAG TPA: hypothetical protein VF054_12190 [Micromonosporaceae bacterium]
MAVVETHVSVWDALLGRVANRSYGAPDGRAGSGQRTAERAFASRRPVPPRQVTAPPSPLPPVARPTRRRTWWRLPATLILLVVVVSTVAASDRVHGPLWAEVPANAALVQVQRGIAETVVNGRRLTLGVGDEVYIRDADTVSLDTRSSARLLFRGGAYTALCGGSRVAVGTIAMLGHPAGPSVSLDLIQGRLLAYTAAQSPTYGPLALAVDSAGSRAVTHGVTRFAIGFGGLQVAAGRVEVDGVPVRPSGVEPSCGDNSPVDGDDDYPWSGDPSASPSGRGSGSASPSPSSTASPSPSASDGPPSGSPSAGTTDRTTPTFRSVSRGSSTIYSEKCTFGSKTSVIDAHVSDPDDVAGRLTVSASWTATNGASGTITMRWVQNDLYEGTLGPFKSNSNFTITVKVTARDPAGNAATSSSVSVSYIGSGCPLL